MDATIIASVRYHPLCPAHPYQIRAILRLPCSSNFGSVPIDLLIIDLVPAEIVVDIVVHIFPMNAKIVHRDKPINKQQIRKTHDCIINMYLPFFAAFC
jgi:hypothetical protein